MKNIKKMINISPEKKLKIINISVIVILGFICAISVNNIVNILTRPINNFTKAENVRFSSAKQNYAANWERLLNSGFFKYSETDSIPETEIEAEPPASLRELTLIGTISGSWKYAMAMVKKRGEKYSEIFKIGQDVYGYKLVRIKDESIVLKSNGQTFVKELYGEEEEDIPANAAIKPKGGKFTKNFSRAEIEQKTKGNNENLLRGLSLGPLRENGKVTGYKLIKVQPTNIFFDMGIRSGDIIKRINGHPVTSTKRIMDMWESFGTESKFLIDIQRGKVINTYDININD